MQYLEIGVKVSPIQMQENERTILHVVYPLVASPLTFYERNFAQPPALFSRQTQIHRSREKHIHRGLRKRVRR